MARSRSGAVWAGTRDGHVFCSSDRGHTWSKRTDERLGGSGIRSIAVAPNDSSTILVGTKPSALFASHDEGRTWNELGGFRARRGWFWMSPAEPPGLSAYVSAVGISPGSPDVMLAGIEAGAVLRSSDGGRTWSSHRRRADRDCHALCFHAADGAWAYQAGGGGPAFSRDGGASWKHVGKGLDGRYSMACAADPGRPEVWYVSASPYAVWPQLWRMPTAHHDGHAHAGIYRWSGGAGWERLRGGLPQPLDHMPYGLATDPANPGHVYAGLSNGRIWASWDFGDSWEQLDLDLGGVRHGLLVA